MATDPSHSLNHIDTLIGIGTRIDGNIICPGVVHCQGEIYGNVSSNENPNAGLVVDTAGSVTGTVNVSHIAVRGRVVGPVQSSQVIEIHQCGSLVGDVSFKKITIHAGGFVDGLLTSEVAIAGTSASRAELSCALSDPVGHNQSSSDVLSGGFLERIGGARRIGIVILFAIVASATVWTGRDVVLINRPATYAEPTGYASLKGAVVEPPSPAGTEIQQPDQKVVEGNAGARAANVPDGVKPAAQVSSSDHPRVDEENVVSVEGANPRRSAGVFLLISNEPTVLYRKKRGSAGDGYRIATPEGQRVSVSIAPGELIRVAEGKDVVMLFQGKKVPQRAIQGGAWIKFVAK